MHCDINALRWLAWPCQGLALASRAYALARIRVRLYRSTQHRPTRLVSPLFTPLGYYDTLTVSRRYYFSLQDGSTRGYRAPELFSLGTLCELCPDIDHWRTMFRGRRGYVDRDKAGMWLVTSCMRVGRFDPPSDIRPLASRLEQRLLRRRMVPETLRLEWMALQPESP